MLLQPLQRPGRVRSQTQTAGVDALLRTASVRPASSTPALSDQPAPDLIGEYLAAKRRPPAIFTVRNREDLLAADGRRYDELLAYKHPHLLMVEDDDDGDDPDPETNAGQESLIVPRPSPAAPPPTVGRINPNILKTWEELSGGRLLTGSVCVHQQQQHQQHLQPGSNGSSNTTTPGGSIVLSSSTNSSERQSCLLYCPGAGGPGSELIEFTVQRVEQPPTSLGTGGTRTTTGSDGGGGGADFYDSIDAVSTCVVPGRLPTAEQEELAGGGEALADLTSLDRKRMLWSIEIE